MIQLFKILTLSILVILNFFVAIKNFDEYKLFNAFLNVIAIALGVYVIYESI